MGDTTNVLLIARNVPTELVERVYDLAASEIYNVYLDEKDTDSVDYGGEGAVGDAETLAHGLDAIIAETGQDFAYWTQQDPKYEYMGWAFVHVPGVGDANFDCDADGNQQVDVPALLDIVDTAATLEEARERIEKLTYRSVHAAWGKIFK